MKVKRITVHEYIRDNPPTESIFLFNDDCQLVQEILPSKEVRHQYLPNGKEFEELTYLLDGSMTLLDSNMMTKAIMWEKYVWMMTEESSIREPMTG